MTSFRKIIGALAAAAFLASAIAPPALAQAVNPSGASGYSGPIAIGQNVGGLTGSYSATVASGTIGAGLSANSPVFAFRYGGTGFAVIKSVIISAANAGTAFTAGTANLSLYAARAFTASDSGGSAATLTGNNAKLRTSFATTGVSDIRVSSTAALTAGTRTLDTTPLTALNFAIPATSTNYQFGTTRLIFNERSQAGDYPFTLAQNEGFVIQATVPATGTWNATVTVIWDEYAAF